MRRAFAICWRMSALGFRNPRSIWLRYGFEIPESALRFRSDRRALRRCSRMNAPRSRSRCSRASATEDLGPADLVTLGQLGLDAVDHLEHGPAAGRHVPLDPAQLFEAGLQLLVGERREAGERPVGGDLVELAVQVLVEVGCEV